MNPDVPVQSLDLGSKLGNGGQGDVFQVRNHPGEVFKRYHSSAINPEALSALVRFPDSIEPAEREALRRQTAWPLARVTDGPRVVGFLMRKAPDTFIGHTDAGPTLRELQYLLYPRRPLWGDIVPLDTSGRMEIAQEFVRLSQILQDRSVVMGDVSMRNVLWSDGYPAKIYLIDCDGFTVAGGQPVLPQPETPDWTDPKMPPSGADLDTDRYKIALLVGRVLAADAEVRPGEALALPDDVPERIAEGVRACFHAAAGEHGTRPPVSRWASALRGRGTMIFGAPPAVRQPGPLLPMATVDRGADRERTSITLPPRDGPPDQPHQPRPARAPGLPRPPGQYRRPEGA